MEGPTPPTWFCKTRTQCFSPQTSWSLSKKNVPTLILRCLLGRLLATKLQKWIQPMVLVGKSLGANTHFRICFGGKYIMLHKSIPKSWVDAILGCFPLLLSWWGWPVRANFLRPIWKIVDETRWWNSHLSRLSRHFWGIIYIYIYMDVY